MQTNCDIYFCDTEELTANWCSDGLIVDLSDYNEEYVYAEVLVKGHGRYKYTVLVQDNLAMINWKPSEYLQKGTYQAQITFKDSNKQPIQIKSNDCQEYCGLNFWITPNCEYGYKYLNEACGVPLPQNPVIPNLNCTWTLEYKNCSWILNNSTMIEMFYDGKKIIFNNPAKKDGVINAAFLAELDSVEEDAFVASLVAGKPVITYTGTNDVRIFVGGVELEKTCVA